MMFRKPFWGDVMETRVIQLCTYQKNIDRYQGLLKTKLNETERLFLEKRLSEETIAMLQLVSLSASWCLLIGRMPFAESENEALT